MGIRSSPTTRPWGSRRSRRTSADTSPPALRAPAGVVKDVLETWLAGRPGYDPALIRAPTLVIVGEWDAETTRAQGRGVFVEGRGTVG